MYFACLVCFLPLTIAFYGKYRFHLLSLFKFLNFFVYSNLLSCFVTSVKSWWLFHEATKMVGHPFKVLMLQSLNPQVITWRWYDSCHAIRQIFDSIIFRKQNLFGSIIWDLKYLEHFLENNFFGPNIFGPKYV